MAKPQRGLGRGLDALFELNDLPDSAGGGGVSTLRLNDIETNPAQPRKIFDNDSLAELAESIREHGVLQPLLVRPMAAGGYQLVAGERRYRASRLAGLAEVPVVIRELNDSQAMAAALIENLQREDLNPLEEAQGYKELIDKLGMTQEQTAKSVGKSRSAVANSLRLLDMPEAVRDALMHGKITPGHARAIAMFPDTQEMRGMALANAAAGCSVRELEKQAQNACKEILNKTTPKAPTRRDSYFDEVELCLNEGLGRKIRVRGNDFSKPGVLEISFHSREDLAALAKALEGFAD
ncbi:MAG: ParB/RepB/Spo0J family partition protein [Oscillospiraceae bacterium]|nr:ParB/RepB/Spo0J family partition protein [Oscillospiraceae bacterium]